MMTGAGGSGVGSLGGGGMKVQMDKKALGVLESQRSFGSKVGSNESAYLVLSSVVETGYRVEGLLRLLWTI